MYIIISCFHYRDVPIRKQVYALCEAFEIVLRAKIKSLTEDADQLDLDIKPFLDELEFGEQTQPIPDPVSTSMVWSYKKLTCLSASDNIYNFKL